MYWGLNYRMMIHVSIDQACSTKRHHEYTGHTYNMRCVHAACLRDEFRGRLQISGPRITCFGQFRGPRLVYTLIAVRSWPLFHIADHLASSTARSTEDRFSMLGEEEAT